MDRTVVYVRCAEIYNARLPEAVEVDAYLTTQVNAGVQVETHFVQDKSCFMSGEKCVTVKSKAGKLLLLGTIPYHLLVACACRLSDQGYRVEFDPQYILTEKDDPEYPSEYIIKLG